MSKCLDDDVTYRGSITLPSGLNCPVHSFAIFSLRSRAVQNFTRFSRNCFNSEKKYFALSRPSVPSSQLEKSPSQLKTGTEVGYRTMEGISRCQKPLISQCQKLLISHCQKHLICGQIYDSRGSGYRCFELEDIGVKVVVCLRITTLQRQPATGEGEGGKARGERENRCRQVGAC